MQERLLVSVRIVPAGCTPEPGRTPDQRLVDLLPERGRPHEGLVVEAGRQHGREERVDRHQIEAQRRPAILACSHQAIVKLGGGGARIGLSAGALPQLDERVRLLRAGREDAPRPVILERAPDQMHPVRQQRRCQRVARMPAVPAAVEGERKQPIALDETAGRQARRLIDFSAQVCRLARRAHNVIPADAGTHDTGPRGCGDLRGFPPSRE